MEFRQLVYRLTFIKQCLLDKPMGYKESLWLDIILQLHAMHSITFISLLAPIVLVITTVNAGMTAWSGGSCDGAQGLDVPCDGSCHDFRDRHSFLVCRFCRL